MKKFIVLYHATKSALEQMGKGSKEDMKKGMDLWYQWAEKCGDALVDLGTPLGKSHFVGGNGSSTVCGYSIVQAESLGEAKKLFENHPHVGWAEGCTIEILECLPMPGE